MVKNPQDYPKRHLVCVSGATPQIITETLYALALAPEQVRFQPTDITILTTQLGQNLIEETLLSEGGGLDRLYQDYPAMVRPASITIEVIRNDAGEALKDIHTPADSEALADKVVSVIREVTADEDAAVHVSLAGGRKTMSFLAGYALSIFGRLQDRLSHVLVDPEFESSREFWYPTPEPRVVVRHLPDGTTQELDASTARITLTDIPFVAMRYLAQDMPLLAQDKLSYRKAVALMAMVASRHAVLELDMTQLKARIMPLDEELRLSRIEFLVLAWVARMKMEQPDRPLYLEKDTYDKALALEFCRFYSQVDNSSSEYEEACEALGINPDYLTPRPGSFGLDPNYVRPKISKISSAARKLLGGVLAKTLFSISRRAGKGRIELVIPEGLDIRWVGLDQE